MKVEKIARPNENITFLKLGLFCQESGVNDKNDVGDDDDYDAGDDVCGHGGHFHANRSQDGSTSRRLLQRILNSRQDG